MEKDILFNDEEKAKAKAKEKEWYKAFRKSNGDAIFSTELMKKAPKISKSRFDFIPKKIKSN